MTTIDPSLWKTPSISRATIGVDLGFHQDHSALVVLGERQAAGRPHYGVMHARQFPLQTPWPVVKLAVLEQWQRFHTWGFNRPCQIVLDAAHALPQWADLASSTGLHPPPVGAVLTSALRHAVKPEPIVLAPGKGNARSVYGWQWSVSRNGLIEGIQADLSGKTLTLTEMGDGGVLIAEMRALTRVVTAARNVRYEPPAGAHDDMTIALGLALWGIRCLPKPQQRREVKNRPVPSAAAWT